MKTATEEKARDLRAGSGTDLRTGSGDDPLVDPFIGDGPGGAAGARRRFGRIAGALFLVGGLSSIPSSLLVEPGPSPQIVLVTAFAVVGGLACLALPWERLAVLWIHIAVAVGGLTVALAIAAASPSYGIYCILIAVFVAYAFRSRVAIAAHLSLLTAAILAPLVYSPDSARETLQIGALLIPNMLAASALMASLRARSAGIERSYRNLAGEASALADRINSWRGRTAPP